LLQKQSKTKAFARALVFASSGSGLESVEQLCRGVAQPGSAPALGAGGPRFKSARPDQSTSYVFQLPNLHTCLGGSMNTGFDQFIKERKYLTNVTLFFLDNSLAEPLDIAN
jgi:hypothetical protein